MRVRVVRWVASGLTLVVLSSGCGVGLRAGGARGPSVPAETGPASATTSASPLTIAPGSRVAVVLPPDSVDRWATTGRLLSERLSARGLIADVRHAAPGDAVSDQQAYLLSQLARGARVVVLAPAEPTRFAAQAQAAKASGATLISYDRLVTDSPDVDYFVGYDERKVGQLQAQALIRGMARRKPGGPFQVELFVGAPGDRSAQARFAGVMDVLGPQLRPGSGAVLVNGPTDYATLAGAGPAAADGETGGADVAGRLQRALERSAQGRLDGVLAADDAVAARVVSWFAAAGRPQPVVVGQNWDSAALDRIRRGTQYATVHRDPDALVEALVRMTDELQAGRTPAVNDTRSADNGRKVVPASLVAPVLVTRELIDTIPGLPAPPPPAPASSSPASPGAGAPESSQSTPTSGPRPGTDQTGTGRPSQSPTVRPTSSPSSRPPGTGDPTGRPGPTQGRGPTAGGDQSRSSIR